MDGDVVLYRLLDGQRDFPRARFGIRAGPGRKSQLTSCYHRSCNQYRRWRSQRPAGRQRTGHRTRRLQPRSRTTGDLLDRADATSYSNTCEAANEVSGVDAVGTRRAGASTEGEGMDGMGWMDGCIHMTRRATYITPRLRQVSWMSSCSS